MTMKKNSKSRLDIRTVTESLNGRVIVLQCSQFKSDQVQQICLIKVINLVGQWPQGPTVFKRKNYQTLYEFVRVNNNTKQTNNFIKDTIQDLMKFSALQIKIQLPYPSSKLIPTQIFISNSGKRVSFWLSQTHFNHLFNILTKLGLTSLLENFQWISPEQQQVYSNQIEYGSQNFINLIEKFSLQSVMQLIDIRYYSQNEFKKIQQSLHNVFSLVNYNYRYFYPPKDATRFLKKTSGVILLSKEQFKQQKSKKWAQSVLLQSILQLRPTFALCQILSRFQGPLYLQKYVFSQKFYSSKQEIYFMGRIQNYFHEDNLRNNLKYLTFVSRICSEYLMLQQSQKYIQKLRKQGWLEDKGQLSLKSHNQEDQIEQDSEQEQLYIANKQQGEIKSYYKNSKKLLMKELNDELSQMLSFLKQNRRQKNGFIQVQQQNVKLSAEISQLRQSCLHVRVSVCLSCGYSNSRISNNQNSLNEFLTMSNQGSDKFCLSCSGLSIKDKIISRKQRLNLQLQQLITMTQKSQNKTIQILTTENKHQYQPQNHIQSQQNLMIKKRTNFSTTTPQISLHPSQKIDTQGFKENKEKCVLKSEEALEIKQQKEYQQHYSQVLRQKQKQVEQKNLVEEEKPKTNGALLETYKKLISKSQQQPSLYHIKQNIQGEQLFAQKHLDAWSLMEFRLNNMVNQPITAEFMHDSLQLSHLSGPLTSQEYISDELLDIYQHYFTTMIKYFIKFSAEAQSHIHSIPFIQRNLSIINQRKYMKVESNVFSSVFSKTLKTSKNQTKLFSMQNQQYFLTDNLYAFLDIKLQGYKGQVSQHYKTYKNVMNQQYRVTEIELKQMIVKFQQDLKNSIIKTTQEFLLTSRWIVLFISEYAEFKTLQIKKNKMQPQDLNDIVYFINQIQFLLNLIATFVHLFNQPGQIKIIQQAQNQILNLIFLLIQNEKIIQKHSNLPSQMDLQVVGILITDMLDHFVSKKSSQATQDAKKLTNKHYTKLKSILQTKLKTLSVQRILDFHQDLRKHQMKIASQCLMDMSKKDILTVKNLYVNGQVNSMSGFFSSLLYLQKQFQKYQTSFYTNQQIKAHIVLLGLVMERCLDNSKLAMRSKSEPQYSIKFGIIYKLILQTIQKPEQAAQLIAVHRSGNIILIDLINYLISLSFRIASQSQSNEQIAQAVKLYIQRVRHHHLKYTPKTIKNYAQVFQILEFLFKNRNSFFDIQNQSIFEIQFHMIVQIVILNALPLYNIELAYKSQLKEINKQLRHFDVNDHYYEIQDYYLKVVSYRHDKAKEKRKKQIQNKKEKSQKNF